MAMTMAIRNLPTFRLALMATVWRRHQNQTYPVWTIQTVASFSEYFSYAFQLAETSAVLRIRWRKSSRMDQNQIASLLDE
jgi:hypothetical protein